MRPPEELDRVDWSALTHAYGSAEDVPVLIRDLYSQDAERIETAMYELHGNIWHQGSVYPATAAAVPFLAHAAAHAVVRQDELLMLLVTLADQADQAGCVAAQVRIEVVAMVPPLLRYLDDPDPTAPCAGRPSAWPPSPPDRQPHSRWTS